ncbi:Putative protein of unknown function [Podospora comata]|uniref:Dynamin-type G domain-containing protein n=1 Tax=Podospora comata TaxID=48703 RepID=A0ABY6RYL0_PODCO|nr:Putative protein of unknown function [Podospora comata]
MSYRLNGHQSSSDDEHDAGVPGAMLRARSTGDEQILAAMDKLRKLGIDQKYDLPQIIVCGSQSAGKSSVLESLVQVPFPRSEKTCTRYVTKVTILPAETPSVEVCIQPGPNRSPEEKQKLNDFRKNDSSPDYARNLAQLMREAHRMIYTDTTKDPMISRDVMLVTVRGPNTRPLEVLDLPGLINYDHNEEENDTLIEGMVTEYMAVKQSIILAVIKATDDLNNQKVLKFCKIHDPTGQRTLGIITRPDCAEKLQRENLIAVMQGRDSEFHFKHRWHVLRNRTSEEMDFSQKQRDENEKRLLDGHPWSMVDKSYRGIHELRERLRELLFSLAKRELPTLCSTFREKLGQLEAEFEQLGGDEFQDGELQNAVEASLEKLRKAAGDHARGKYEADVRNHSTESPVFLRSRIVEKSEVFRDRLIAEGHGWKTNAWSTVPDPDSDLGSVYREENMDGRISAPVPKSSDAETDEVVKMLKESRGQTLPGFWDSDRIARLFWLMSEGWKSIASDHVKQVHLCCERYFREYMPVAFKGFGNPHRVAASFVGLEIIKDMLDRSQARAKEELERLECDRQDFLLNFDMRFLKDRRSFKQGREFERAMKAQHQATQSAGDGKTPSNGLDPTTYAQHAGRHSQLELTFDTAEEYLYAMASHYLVGCIIHLRP